MKKYERVVKEISGKIDSGMYKSGDKLPELKNLCKEYDVSHITIQKALEILRDEGYVERIKSKGTYVKKPHGDEKNIGLVISIIDRKDTSLLNIIKGAQSQAAKLGYNLLVEITDGIYENEVRAVQTLINRDTEALILYLNHNEVQDVVNQHQVYHIMLDHYNPIYPCNSVTVNNIDGGFLATDHLIKKGHHKIAFLSTDLTKNTEKDRYQGYHNACTAANVKVLEPLMTDAGNMCFEHIEENIQKGLLTAAFAVNDHVALLLLRYLYSKGFQIPRDFSIVGFDDSAESQLSIVPLTTIHQPFADVGAEAVAMLDSMFYKQKSKKQYKKVFVPIRLVERDSVDKPIKA